MGEVLIQETTTDSGKTRTLSDFMPDNSCNKDPAGMDGRTDWEQQTGADAYNTPPRPAERKGGKNR